MSEQPEVARATILAVELRILISKLRQRLRAEAHLGDFTWSQLQVLTWLESHGPATVTTLARAQGMRPQSMGEILSVLKAAGLVCGAPDPEDGRQIVLSLSAACREKIRAIRAAKDDWLFHAIQTRLAPAEQAQLATGIELLRRLAE